MEAKHCIFFKDLTSVYNLSLKFCHFSGIRCLEYWRSAAVWNVWEGTGVEFSLLHFQFSHLTSVSSCRQLWICTISPSLATASPLFHCWFPWASSPTSSKYSLHSLYAVPGPLGCQLCRWFNNSRCMASWAEDGKEQERDQAWCSHWVPLCLVVDVSSEKARGTSCVPDTLAIVLLTSWMVTEQSHCLLFTTKGGNELFVTAINQQDNTYNAKKVYIEGM